MKMKMKKTTEKVCPHYFGIRTADKKRLISWTECNHPVLSRHAYEDIVGVATRVSVMTGGAQIEAVVFVNKAEGRYAVTANAVFGHIPYTTPDEDSYGDEFLSWKRTQY